MRLTSFSDYALRLLIHAASNPDRLITIDETARTYDISRGHLTKVATALTQAGFLIAVRGRAGGLKMAYAPQNLTIAEVLRATEPDIADLECFGAAETRQPGRPVLLEQAIQDAMRAFIKVMENRTLADLIKLDPRDLPKLAAKP